MSKLVAKFRKERDYNDDYVIYDRKRKNKEYNPAKKLSVYEYDNYLNEFEEDINNYQKSSRRKARGYY